MKILGIETSCDDTCASLVEVQKDGFFVHSNVVASQANLHAKYGGVVPELAARMHVESILPTIQEALGSFTHTDIDAIAVTQGPGLITSLHVGVETAKTLAYIWDKPLIPTNHMAGHLYSALLPHVGEKPTRSLSSIVYPALGLIVSGGHTELVLIEKPGVYTLVGRTRDDAAGEAFDKAAKMLGLTYPGGPEISKHAQQGKVDAFTIPRPMMYEKGFEFSFSGMKNAIRLLIEKEKPTRHSERSEESRDAHLGAERRDPSPTAQDDEVLSEKTINNFSASIEHAIVDVLVTKSVRAVEQYKPKTFILAGGVSANKKLRETLTQALPTATTLLIPELAYCMDNAAMIAVAGYFSEEKLSPQDAKKCTAQSGWELV